MTSEPVDESLKLLVILLFPSRVFFVWDFGEYVHWLNKQAIKLRVAF
ncbi:hypothetical protein MUP05_00220 [Candidatus Bathyarchaeota archaeon]|nr:hypothetical protein [Candidatus Bathyarchaeota archaeon]